jgi:hypothetical protein
MLGWLAGIFHILADFQLFIYLADAQPFSNIANKIFVEVLPSKKSLNFS